MICCACAGHDSVMEKRDLSRQPAAEDCPVLYVLAPANYIIELAADSRVILDPAWHEFVLYCSSAAARKAQDEMVKLGAVRPGEWRVFILEGSYEELAKIENGCMILASPARLQTWLETEG